MTALSTKEAWDTRQLLMDAARYIDIACSIAERDSEASTDVRNRLAEFDYVSIDCSLEELAAEIRKLAAFITYNVWEVEEHLCGYSVAAGDRIPVKCFHESCWNEQEFIEAAAEMQARVRVMLADFVNDEECGSDIWLYDKENPECDCLCHGPNAGLKGHHHTGCDCRENA